MSSVTSRRAVGRASVLGYPPSRGVVGLDLRRAAVIYGRCRNPRRAMSVPAADLEGGGTVSMTHRYRGGPDLLQGWCLEWCKTDPPRLGPFTMATIHRGTICTKTMWVGNARRNYIDLQSTGTSLKRLSACRTGWSPWQPEIE